jgi:transmembrane sensor
MNIEEYRSFTTEDFVLDREFAEWVLSPKHETDLFWAGFLASYPDKNEPVNDAAFMIRGMQSVDQEIPAARLEAILHRIEGRHARRGRRMLLGLLKYAAVFAGVVGIAGTIWLLTMQPDPFPMAPVSADNSTNGKVILSDGSSIEFNTQETVIAQTSGGELLINSDTVDHLSSGKPDVTGLNRVIIPYGKRSQLTLPDGSHIWLNSGSQLSYPDAFSGKSREVYLVGEAFFDVAPDAEKPFYVITKDIRIKVLGTRFNVSAYDDEESAQAVLLEGSVTIGRNATLVKSEELKPGERAVYHKKTERFTKETADVNYYTSWLYGYLIFENEPTPEVFKKLERYYNQSIVVDEGLDAITFSGKLDLKEDIREVLESITYSSSVSITSDGAIFKVTR